MSLSLHIPCIQFKSLEQATKFKYEREHIISRATDFALSCDSVCYAETWLCEHCPSYVAGFNSDDDIIVSVPLHIN